MGKIFLEARTGSGPLLLVSDERLLLPAVFIDFGIELCENPRQKGI
jgi:hypothetical protein